MPVYHTIRVVCDICDLELRSDDHHVSAIDLCCKHGWEVYHNHIIVCPDCQEEQLDVASWKVTE